MSEAAATASAPEVVEIERSVLDEILKKTMDKGLASFTLVPKTFEEAAKYASYIHKSQFCPKGWSEQDVFIAVQMGMELGLKPMAAIQGIAVINGKPTIYGDLALAVCQASGLLEVFKEHDQHKAGAGKAGWCRVKRKGDPEIHEVTFSESDAKIAGLIGKAGPWSQYPGRMYQMRARAFALRDKFADVLKGLHIREEVQDYPAAATPLVNEILSQPQRKSDAVPLPPDATATAQEETKKIEAPPSPGTWKGKLDRIETQTGTVQEGKKKGQPYTLFYLHTKDGQKFASFSTTVRDFAQTAIEGSLDVEIEHLPGQSCPKVKSIAPLAEPGTQG